MVSLQPLRYIFLSHPACFFFVFGTFKSQDCQADIASWASGPLSFDPLCYMQPARFNSLSDRSLSTFLFKALLLSSALNKVLPRPLRQRQRLLWGPACPAASSLDAPAAARQTAVFPSRTNGRSFNCMIALKSGSNCRLLCLLLPCLA